MNNHIRKLYSEGLVKQETGRGSCRYYLSKKGKAAAGKLALAKQANQIVYEGKTAGQIKSAFEEMQRIVNLAQSRYPTNLNAFFSCYAELTTKTPVEILKDPDPSQK